MENKGTIDTIKILSHWFSNFKEVTAEESWGDTQCVFDSGCTVQSSKVAHWAFNSTGAAVVKVVGALYRDYLNYLSRISILLSN